MSGTLTSGTSTSLGTTAISPLAAHQTVRRRSIDAYASPENHTTSWPWMETSWLNPKCWRLATRDGINLETSAEQNHDPNVVASGQHSCHSRHLRNAATQECFERGQNRPYKRHHTDQKCPAQPMCPLVTSYERALVTINLQICGRMTNIPVVSGRRKAHHCHWKILHTRNHRHTVGIIRAILLYATEIDKHRRRWNA